jgi:nucleoid-associated protein YgaU
VAAVALHTLYGVPLGGGAGIQVPPWAACKGENVAQFMHTVRFVIGMAMLAAGVALAQPFAAAVLAARGGFTPAAYGPATAPPTPGTQSGLSAMMIGSGGHAIPDPRPTGGLEGLSGPPMAATGPFLPTAPPPPPVPLPASGLDLSPASPLLDGTYRSTVDIPPPPLLDVHAPPPLSAGWSVHDVARPVAPGPALQSAAMPADYVVRDGDDLTGIALKVYGHAGAATAIWTANRDRLTDPQVLPIGLALRLPPSWMLPAAHAAAAGATGAAIEPTFTTAHSGERAGTGVAADPVRSAAPSGPEPFWLQGGAAPSPSPSAILTAGPGHRSIPEATAVPSAPAQRPATVRVGMGDSLESIAVRFYGDRAMASRIWLANRDRLRSPDLLVPGAELRLP